MKTLKYLGYVVGGVGALVLVMFWFQSNKMPEKSGEVTSLEVSRIEINKKVKMNTDVYPLYEGAEWGETEEISNGLFKVESVPFTDTDNIAAMAMPFTDYYHQKLLAAGWEQDMMREASGPGANVSTYTKDGQFITVAFKSDFKVKNDNAPSECPCDLTLSITSGKE